MIVRGHSAIRWVARNGMSESELNFLRGQMSSGAELEVETTDFLFGDTPAGREGIEPNSGQQKG